MYFLTLLGPADSQLALEGALEEFEENAAPFPQRVTMLDQSMARFKLAANKVLAKDLYGRIESAHLSPDDTARCKKKSPSLELTKDDLHTAGSGTDVVKVLVLTNAGNESASEPDFEVLTSTVTRRLPDLLNEATRRGTVIAALELSEHLPPLTPFLPSQQLPSRPDDRFVRVRIRGPEGLALAHKLPVGGRVMELPQPIPTHLAFLPGIEARLELKGPPLSAGTSLCVWISVSRPWPTELGPPGKTELPIDLSKNDLEAAAAGKRVTHVIYLAKHSKPKEPPRVEVLNSLTMLPSTDVVAEASRRGQVLATVKLSNELPMVRDDTTFTLPDHAAANAFEKALPPPAPEAARQTQILFLGPEGMVVQWDVVVPGKFDSDPLVVPGGYNFPTANIYALKLCRIPGHDGVEIYPTLEVAPPLPRTANYLKHNAVPIELSQKDIDVICSGKDFTKVVYLPDEASSPDERQAVESMVNWRMDAGLDPIVEADHRGAILAILRVDGQTAETSKAAGLDR